ncbi:MAG: LPS export ABC transporter permease LptF [Magnetococcales bacterium]|nr:LPS export ABC transporter permease LptF [Magnetococcales bacterium]NGZ26576.1 LPS export ABC transporter permease LptF [Magnetococcales bacterium]
MIRITRYLFMECGQTTGVSLLVLTFLLLLPQVLDLVDLWVNKDAPISVLLDMILLMVPRLLLITLPMSLLLGILLAMGRLSDDSEIVVMKAAGMSLWQISTPILPLAIFTTLFSFWLTWQVVPESRHTFVRLKETLLTSTLLSLKPQFFNHPASGLTIHIQEKDGESGVLRGLFIHDHRRPNQQMTVTAREGMIYRKPDGRGAILLKEGSQHQILEKQAIRQMTFATYDLDLGITMDMASGGQSNRPELMSHPELMMAMTTTDAKQNLAARMEWHRRLAIPLATLILGMTAIPLGVHHHRSGRGYNLVLAIALMLIHMLLLTMGEGLAKRQLVTPLLGFWLPNILMIMVAAYLLIQANRERTPAFSLWLDRLLTLLPQRLLGRSENGSS